MTEDNIHRDVLKYFRTVLPHGWLVMHVPNGGSRNKIEAAKLKRLGTLAGWPDLQILGCKGHNLEPWAGFVEIKTAKGRLSPAQIEIHDRLRDAGFAVGVCRSIDDARDFAHAHELPSRDIRLVKQNPAFVNNADRRVKDQSRQGNEVLSAVGHAVDNSEVTAVQHNDNEDTWTPLGEASSRVVKQLAETIKARGKKQRGSRRR